MSVNCTMRSLLPGSFKQSQFRKLFLVFCGCLLLFACKNAAAPEPEPFTLMSYNIRFDTERDTGSHDWNNRKENVADVMRQADIIGIQEPTLGQAEDLNALLLEYESFSRDTFDINAIFYLPGKFKLIRADTIRLPQLDGSAVKHTIHWACFIDQANNLPFLMYNTHLDHAGEKARQKGSEILIDSAAVHRERYQIENTVVTCDLNTTDGTAAYQLLIADDYRDTALEGGYTGEMNTFTGWGFRHLWNEWSASLRKPQYFLRIDYIFVKNFEIVDFRLIKSTASDHFPIIATIR